MKSRVSWIRGVLIWGVLGLSLGEIQAQTRKTSRVREPRGLGKLYHNLTARYNAYFVAWHALFTAQQEVLNEANLPPDPDSMWIELFPEWSPEFMQSRQASLEKAIEKCNIGLNLHPFSKWVDDCYFVIGVAQYLTGDSTKASSTLRYLVEEYPPPRAPSRYRQQQWNAFQRFRYRWRTSLLRRSIKHNYRFFEGALHLAKLYAEQGKYSRADYWLHQARSHHLFPRKLLPRYWGFRVQIALRRGQYQQALQFLDSALAVTRNHHLRARMFFLRAQILSYLGEIPQAVESFRACEKEKPHPEISFTARTRRYHLALEYGLKASWMLRSSILRELRREEDPERRARLLYLLGLIELREGKDPRARRYFREALSLTTNPVIQKKLYLKLLEIAIKERNWIAMDNITDTLIRRLNWQDPLWVERKPLLDQLADSLRQKYHLDTLVWLSSLSRKERFAFFRKLQRNLLQEPSSSRGSPSSPSSSSSPAPQTPPTGRSGMPAGPGRGIPGMRNPARQTARWYFYNPSLVAGGKREFRRIWGNRPLEDFWRIQDASALAEYLPDTLQEKALSSTHPYIERLLAELPEDRATIRAYRRRIARLLVACGGFLAEMEMWQEADSFFQLAEQMGDTLFSSKDTFFWVELYRWRYLTARALHHPLSETKYLQKLQEFLSSSRTPIPRDSLERLQQLYHQLLRWYQEEQDSLILHTTAFLDSVLLPSLRDGEWKSPLPPPLFQIALIRSYALGRSGNLDQARLWWFLLSRVTSDPEMKQHLQVLMYVKKESEP